MIMEYDMLTDRLNASNDEYDGYWIDVDRRNAIVDSLEMQALEMARYIVKNESEG